MAAGIPDWAFAPMMQFVKCSERDMFCKIASILATPFVIDSRPLSVSMPPCDSGTSCLKLDVMPSNAQRHRMVGTHRHRKVLCERAEHTSRYLAIGL